MAAMPCPGCQPVFEKAHINYFIQPGAQQVVTFTADQSGIYKYFCMVRGHIWLGMAGDFIVENPTQQTKPSPEKVLGRSENQ
jgi:FtsP/CotA-like multicopper oxidase with cupredoxin domain